MLPGPNILLGPRISSLLNLCETKKKYWTLFWATHMHERANKNDDICLFLREDIKYLLNTASQLFFKSKLFNIQEIKEQNNFPW